MPKKDQKHWYCSLSVYTQSIQTPFVARCYDLNLCYIESHAQTSMAGAAAVVPLPLWGTIPSLLLCEHAIKSNSPHGCL